MAYRKSAFWDHLKYVKSNEQKNEGDNRYHRWRTQAVWTKKPPHSNVICQLENKCKDPNQFYYSWNLFVWRFSTHFLENSLSQTGHLNFFLMSISLRALTWCRFKSDFLLNICRLFGMEYSRTTIISTIAGSCGLFWNVPDLVDYSQMCRCRIVWLILWWQISSCYIWNGRRKILLKL